MTINTHKKTFNLKPADVTRKWVVIDASEAPLGRVATVIAKRLSGKYQPSYTPHVDSGDFVVVINAANVVATGNKMDEKVYYNYSGYPSGLKEITLRDQLAKNPAKVIESAVKGMLPKNKLAAERMKRLKVYAGSEHAHAAQKPETLGVKV